jgi:hypothetical protein
MNRHFYAKDHANTAQMLWAFTTKAARDGFVADGNRRFSLTASEADDACKSAYECTAQEAVAKGFI